jgi:hypothetical protein
MKKKNNGGVKSFKENIVENDVECDISSSESLKDLTSEIPLSISDSIHRKSQKRSELIANTNDQNPSKL